MKEYLKIINEYWRLLVFNIIGLAIALIIIYLYTNFSSLSSQQGIIRIFISSYESLQFSNLDIKKNIALLGYQILLFLFCGGLLKIIFNKKKPLVIFLVSSLFILLSSIILTNISFPFLIKLMTHTIDNLVSVPSISGMFFIQNQIIIWILLNATFLPIYFTFTGLYKNQITSKKIILFFGYILLIAGLITPPDVFSQLIVGVLISLFWLIGFMISKHFRNPFENIKTTDNIKIYYLICAVFSIILLIFSGIEIISLPEITAIISVLILIQNLIIIANIFHTDKVSSLFALIIPFFLPYYILKNISSKFNNIIFYKIYSVFLIVLTSIIILKSIN